MEISKAHAESLGAKLAGLDLGEEEAALLEILIHDDEVTGFASDDSHQLPQIRGAFTSVVLRPVEQRWSFGANNAGLQECTISK